MNNRSILYIILGVLISPFILSALIPFMIVILVISSLNPLSETISCQSIKCTTTSNLIIGRSEQTAREQVTNKNLLEIQTVTDAIGIRQYYIRMKDNNERYAFRTSYLSRRNAERDLKKIKENYIVKITKRNVAFIQCLCIFLYIILLIIGTIVNRKNSR